MRICHFTSVHPRYDTRIFIKECNSLVNNGFDVTLIVADNLNNEIKNGINIINVGSDNEGRIKRMTHTAFKIYRELRKNNYDIFHFHDPELLPIALLLKFKGKRVIYDIHEDTPRDILSKNWIKKWQRNLVSKCIEKVENFTAKRFTHLITATPFIEKRFKKLTKNVTNINNYPLINELSSDIKWDNKKKQICFIGGINVERGIYEIIDALESIDIELILAGEFETDIIEKKSKEKEGWKKVNYLGHINRDRAKSVLAESIAGLVTYHPEPNHINAQPNKIFEYMSAGIPVIVSNFSLWRQIIETNKCGICVDPLNSIEISEAIQFLKINPDQALKMGLNGKRAVEEIYNWEKEEKKLISIYNSVLAKNDLKIKCRLI